MPNTSVVTPSSPHAVIGIDFGLKRTGLAVGNTLTQAAQPLEIFSPTIDANADRAAYHRALIQHILTLAKNWEARVLVIGIPCHPDGTAHAMTEAVQAFIHDLAQATPLPIQQVNEQYSSAVIPAKHQTNARGQTRSTPLDDQSAAIILQQYLDGLS